MNKLLLLLFGCQAAAALSISMRAISLLRPVNSNFFICLIGVLVCLLMWLLAEWIPVLLCKKIIIRFGALRAFGWLGVMFVLQAVLQKISHYNIDFLITIPITLLCFGCEQLSLIVINQMISNKIIAISYLLPEKVERTLCAIGVCLLLALIIVLR